MLKTRIIWITALLAGFGAFSLLPASSSAVGVPPRTSLHAVQEAQQPEARPLLTQEQPARQQVTAETAQQQLPPAHSAEAPATATEQPSVSYTDDASSLNVSISQWLAELSAEHGFAAWKDAAWTNYPLGPGTHGWVVLLEKDGQEIGYLIVHAADDGALQLTEYGTGAHPLFSLHTLYRALVQQALISDHQTFATFMQDASIKKERLYYDTSLAFWKITIHEQISYIDGKTGEWLPLNDELSGSLPSVEAEAALPGKQHAAAEQLLVPAFDPYDRMPWVAGEPSLPGAEQPQALKDALSGHAQLTYVASLLDGDMMIPLAVIGYRQSGQAETYIALEQEGPRFVLYRVAMKQAELYL